MKSRFLAITLVSLLGSATHNAVTATPPPEQKPSWQTDYQRAKEIARREDKPLFIVFR
jgi:hypothetical protein